MLIFLLTDSSTRAAAVNSGSTGWARLKLADGHNFICCRGDSSHLWNINGKIVTLYGYVCRSLATTPAIHFWYGYQLRRRHKSTQRFAASLAYEKDELDGEREDEGKWFHWGQTGRRRGVVSPCVSHLVHKDTSACTESEGVTMSDIKLCLFVILESIYSSAMCEPNKLNFINIRLFDTHALKSLGFLSFSRLLPIHSPTWCVRQKGSTRNGKFIDLIADRVVSCPSSLELWKEWSQIRRTRTRISALLSLLDGRYQGCRLYLNSILNSFPSAVCSII